MHKRFVLVCSICVSILLLSHALERISAADPSTLPLLQFSDLQYAGAFRLPVNSTNGDSFEIGGMPVAYNATTNSLYIGSRLGKVAEVTIPAPVNSATIG